MAIIFNHEFQSRPDAINKEISSQTSLAHLGKADRHCLPIPRSIALYLLPCVSMVITAPEADIPAAISVILLSVLNQEHKTVAFAEGEDCSCSMPGPVTHATLQENNRRTRRRPENLLQTTLRLDMPHIFGKSKSSEQRRSSWSGPIRCPQTFAHQTTSIMFKRWI
ncbi:hypothetical protein [Aestuariivirga sp.]|uniref:hypothetical protein n=1 Tax=Aestuariivirga sp. TaxID=2650926 RepID=UPI003782EC69